MELQETGAFSHENQVPLVVDLDGTLLRTDTLWEGLRYVCFHKPLLFIKYVTDFMIKELGGGGGRLTLKWDLTPWILQGVGRYPLNQAVCGLLRQADAAGRPVYLASGSTLPVVLEMAKRCGFFTSVFASSRERNLIGEEKARLLVETFGCKGFDYIGDSTHDIPVWKVARRALVVGASPALKENLALTSIPPESTHSKLGIVAKAARLHQWVKNLLVFVPMVTAHAFTAKALGESLLAFFALCFCASAIYLVNDILDIDDDRAHPKKAERPFASGSLPLKYAPLGFTVLILSSFLVGSFLSTRFMLFLLVYFVSAICYSLIFKKLVIVDILTLALLYVLRILLGIVAINCDFSQWLFYFFFFLFLGLAAIKRLGGLASAIPRDANTRRQWKTEDRTFLLPFSICCGIGSTVIFAIYCNSDMALKSYRYPYFLSSINIIFLYWYQRIVLLVNRGIIQDDPLDYAIKAPSNYFLYLMVSVILFLSI